MSAAHAELIHVAEVPFARARSHAATVEGILSTAAMIRKPHSDVEQLLDKQGREWARLMLEEHLALRAGLEKKTEVVGSDGVERCSSRDSERHLETVVGRVAVPRQAYQAPGVTDLHPMDAGCGAESSARDVLSRHSSDGREGGCARLVRRSRRDRARLHRVDDRQTAGRGARGTCGAGLRRVLRGARGGAWPTSITSPH